MPVPLVADKVSQPSILSPQVFAQHSAKHGWLDGHAVPEAALMLYHRGLTEMVVQPRSATIARGFLADYFLLEEFDRRIALVANFGIGSPAAAFTLEDLVGAGARCVMSVGTCGAVQPDLAPGSLIMPTSALRDEGTSYHYVADGEPALPDGEMLASTRAEINRRGLTVAEGPCWTTDAPYRETPQELRLHRDAGVVAVEMEAAALFVVGAVRGVPVASLLAVSDVLEEHDWVPAFHANETIESLLEAVDVAITVLSGRLDG